jgi:sugar phosphate isomerase/epimerase
MRLAISNIAWDIAQDVEVAELLNRWAIDAIDIAPGKYFPDPANASHEQIEAVRRWWSDRGIELTGMQSLLFGTTGLNMFGNAESQQAMLDHLGAVCRIGAGLGATRLVFGSPRNRDRAGLDNGAAVAVAVPFLQRLGDIAAATGVIVCLEPNPVSYGANFMTTSFETVEVVERVAHPSIRMQFDTGALEMNKENVSDVLDRCSGWIGHVHASEPGLVPLGGGRVDHVAVHAELSVRLPSHIVSVEMIATREEPALQAVDRALGIAVSSYRSTSGACA